MWSQRCPISVRAAEREAVSAAYASAVAGHSHVLLITGEAGKTRLGARPDRTGRPARWPGPSSDRESAPLAGAALAYGPFVAALGERAHWLLADDQSGP